MTGTVKWFNDAKGFGFISPDPSEDTRVLDGNEAFVHHSDIEMPGHRTLVEGAHVCFSLTDHGKGLKAVCVRPEEDD